MKAVARAPLTGRGWVGPMAVNVHAPATRGGHLLERYQRWVRGRFIVTSGTSLDEHGAEWWHVGISCDLKPPPDDATRRVLAEFGMTDAAEDNSHAGPKPRARHFWLPAVEGAA